MRSEVPAGLGVAIVQSVAQVRIAAEQTDVAELTRLRGLYEELIFAVGNKCPGETRHQTALRYIQQAEVPYASTPKSDGPQVELPGLLPSPAIAASEAQGMERSVKPQNRRS